MIHIRAFQGSQQPACTNKIGLYLVARTKGQFFKEILAEDRTGLSSVCPICRKIAYSKRKGESHV